MTEKEAIKFLGSSDPAVIVLMLQKLRNKADATEQDFMQHVQAFEATNLWRPGCSGTWAQFLKLTNICDPTRYSRWIAACKELGTNLVAEIGINAATQAVRIPDVLARNEATKLMSATVLEQGTILSERTSRHIAEKYMNIVPMVTRRAEKVDDLKRENAALRAQLKAATDLLEQYRDHFGPLPKKATKSSKSKARAQA